jgi:hypothetical protein
MWPILTLAMVIVLVPAKDVGAQFMAYGGGYGFPAMGYGYGYPGLGYGYDYPGLGYGYAPYAYGGFGYGYGYGYPGYAYGLGYPGNFYGLDNPGFYTPGLMNPLFGVGLTPLGVQSYQFETRLLGRVPRSATRYRPQVYVPPAR